MEGSRGSLGALLAAVSGAALLVIMSALDWYEVSVPENLARFTGGEPTLAFDAWDAFNLIDIGLLAVGAIAIALGLSAAVRARTIVRITSLLAAAAGAGAVIVLVYRVADPPTLSFGGNEIREGGGVEATTELGAILALVAAAGILVGAALSVRQSGATPGVIMRELEGKLEQGS